MFEVKKTGMFYREMRFVESFSALRFRRNAVRDGGYMIAILTQPKLVVTAVRPEKDSNRGGRHSCVYDSR